MAQLAAVGGYAIVVAFTMLPILAVTAVLLDSGRAARGWQLTAGYAVGLAVIFVAASFGLARLSLPSLRDHGAIELSAGVVLLLVAAGLWWWRRTRAGRPHRPGRGHRPVADRISARRSVLVGLQFAVHPENLALTFAAAAHVTDLTEVQRLGAAMFFTAVGVSTVVGPTIAYTVAGDRTKERLTRLRDAITEHGALLAEVLLAAAGIVLVVLGLVQTLSP